ncbi:MAG: DUF3969 family protein [Blautia sp.]|nr:DUF3969 family protein [Blautia sp.]
MKIQRTDLRRSCDKKAILLSVLGTLTALEHETITVDEASCFLFTPGMVDLLKSCHCSRDIINIIEEGCELEDVESLAPKSFLDEIRKLQQKTLDTLGQLSETAEHKWIKQVEGDLSYKKKLEYLENILDTGILPDRENWGKIYQCAKNSTAHIRMAAAHVLGMYGCARNERYLRHLTYDKKRMVRICAIRALQQNGRQKESLDRLFTLMSAKSSAIRGYAAGAYFDIWVNRNGYTVPGMEAYRAKVEERYQKEKDPFVRVFYERNRYLSGDKAGLANLQRLVCETQDYCVQETGVKLLLEMRKQSNEKEMNQIFEEAAGYDEESFYFTKQMRAAAKRKEQPAILIIDQDNSGISQLFEYFGSVGNLRVDSAGLIPAKKINKKVRDFVQHNENCAIQKFQYPKGIRHLWKYDYVVPIGVKLREDEYPFQRIIRMFENEDESVTDFRKAEEMWKELSEFIKDANGL